ncbi:MAG: DNA starvation/stationary phase protection protein, partial [Bacteroidota bacterium]
MKTNIGISEEGRKCVTGILNTLLADEHVIYIKNRNYHWNVTGARFSDLHKFLEAQYNELAETIDEVAERVRKIGSVPAGTMKEFTELSNLKEHPGKLPDADGMLKDLLTDHETIIRFIRENIDKVNDECGDAGSADFITGV